MSRRLDDPRVQPDAYVIYPTCWDEMGNSDRDAYCLTVKNGHAWGWSIRRGQGTTGPMALNRHGRWIFESRGNGNNKHRRWELDEALSIALNHVDRLTINGSTAAECAARWPRSEEDADV